MTHDGGSYDRPMTESIDPIRVELAYPGEPARPSAVVVELIDVRAADDLNITYDYARDGWVIRMASFREDAEGEFQAVDPLVEVAFLPAWNMVT